MPELNKSIAHIPLPSNMRHLPVSSRGYVVPFFVAWHVNGKESRPGHGLPDFRMFGTQNGVPKTDWCHSHNRCWLCGGLLGRYRAFVIGSMCAVNRISAEPPSHLGCANYAAEACPFLANPRMRRNEKDMPEVADQAGIPIMRNPGVCLVWTTRDYRKMDDGKGKTLFHVGEPMQTNWWAEGRKATRAEVVASIESGLPLLRDVARKHDGPEGMAELEKMIVIAYSLLPE
jgi:hypothetical protein